MAAGDISDDLKWTLRLLLADREGNRWSDTELFYFLSEAQRRIAMEADVGALWALTDIHSDTLVGDQDEYSLPSDFAYDRLVRYKGIESTRKSNEQIRELVEGNSYVTPAQDNPFHVIENDQIVFYVSAVTQAGSEVFELYYVRTPVDITTDVDPELPAHFYNAILDLARSLAYESASEPSRAEAEEAYGIEQIVVVNARMNGRDPYDDIAKDARLEVLQEEA